MINAALIDSSESDALDFPWLRKKPVRGILENAHHADTAPG
jgi:hypothetical protein